MTRARVRCLRRMAGAMFCLCAWAGASPAQVVLREWNGVSQRPFGDAFGRSIVGLRDVDGDAVPDVVIGAEGTDVSGKTRVGRVYAYSGKTGALLHSSWGTQQSGYYGRPIAAAGDINRDGRADYFVSAAQPPNSDWLVLRSGKTGLVLRSFAQKYAEAVGVGDVNGDGVPDVLAGNPYVTVGGIQSAGRADLLSGKDWSVLASFVGTSRYQQFGGPRACGDFNADGVRDLLLGDYGSYRFSAPMTGAWAYSGRTRKLLFRLKPPVGTSTFGYTLAGVGDVDGDGYDDVALHDRQSRVIPRYFDILVFGGPDGHKVFAKRWPAPFNPIGDSLAGPGDVDGDGFADVLTGGQGNGGRVFMISGRDQSLLFSLHGNPNVDNIGGAVAGAGDINGDGFPDWLAGTFYDRARNVGIVRLYSGAPKGVKAFGLGCKDARGVVPRIGATRSPKIGTTFQINLCDTLPGNVALLLIGVSNKSWANRSLPLDLGGLVGLPGCLLRVSPDVVLAVRTRGPTKPKAKGRATVPLAIPLDATLRGVRAYAQWLVFDASGKGAATRALEVTVQ